MSTFRANHQKSNLKRIFILLPFLLIAFLARDIVQTYSQRFSELKTRRETHERIQRIEGRWKTVAAALDLASLPDTIVFPDKRPPAAIQPRPIATFSQPRYSRFDLRRKRSEARPDLEEPSHRQVVLARPLRFAADVQDSPSVSLESLASSLRNLASSEQGSGTSSNSSGRAKRNSAPKRQAHKGS